jgi:hypothetical protein
MPRSTGVKRAALSVPSNDPSLPVVDILFSGNAIFCSKMFSDVPPDYRAHDQIITIACDEITAGCGDGRFCPEDPVTRAQAAVLLLKAKGEQPSVCTGSVFTDVNEASVGKTFCGYIEKFSELGITAGCGDGRFCPDDNVTRAQAAVLLLKAKEEQPSVCTGTVFTDVNEALVGMTFCGYIEKFSETGISSGCDRSRYCPYEDVTRADMAVFLKEAFLE